MKYLAVAALLLSTQASATIVQIDTQDLAAHLRLESDVRVSINADYGKVLTCYYIGGCVIETGISLIDTSTRIAWGGWHIPLRGHELDNYYFFPTYLKGGGYYYEYQEGAYLDQLHPALAGPHAQGDFVILDGPIIPDGAGEASLLSFDTEHLAQHLRLTLHVEADSLVLYQKSLIVADWTFSYYDAPSNLGWSTTFHRVTDGSEQGGSFTLIDGPIPSPVPEPESWVALLVGLCAVGWWRRDCGKR